jgi:hypothetical protein
MVCSKLRWKKLTLNMQNVLDTGGNEHGAREVS